MSCWVKSGSEAAVVADGTLWIEGDAKMDIGEQRK
jgi:hypothetical protein